MISAWFAITNQNLWDARVRMPGRMDTTLMPCRRISNRKASDKPSRAYLDAQYSPASTRLPEALVTTLYQSMLSETEHQSASKLPAEAIDMADMTKTRAQDGDHWSWRQAEREHTHEWQCVAAIDAADVDDATRLGSASRRCHEQGCKSLHA